MSQKTQMKKNIHYAAVEENEDYEDYSEEEVYITWAPWYKPYNTDRKTQKEIPKKSESQKEIRLRNQTVFTEPEEIEIEPIEVTKLAKKWNKKLLSIIDQLEPYYISKDLLYRQAQAIYEQLLQYPN